MQNNRDRRINRVHGRGKGKGKSFEGDSGGATDKANPTAGRGLGKAKEAPSILSVVARHKVRHNHPGLGSSRGKWPLNGEPATPQPQNDLETKLPSSV